MTNVERALDYALDGNCDGAHHKMWVIDQVVRALLDCPMVEKEFTDCNGVKYIVQAQGESDKYKEWVAGFDGDWDVGIAP